VVVQGKRVSGEHMVYKNLWGSVYPDESSVMNYIREGGKKAGHPCVKSVKCILRENNDKLFKKIMRKESYQINCRVVCKTKKLR